MNSITPPPPRLHKTPFLRVWCSGMWLTMEAWHQLGSVPSGALIAKSGDEYWLQGTASWSSVFLAVLGFVNIHIRPLCRVRVHCIPRTVTYAYTL